MRYQFNEVVARIRDEEKSFEATKGDRPEAGRRLPVTHLVAARVAQTPAAVSQLSATRATVCSPPVAARSAGSGSRLVAAQGAQWRWCWGRAERESVDAADIRRTWQCGRDGFHSGGRRGGGAQARRTRLHIIKHVRALGGDSISVCLGSTFREETGAFLVG